MPTLGFVWLILSFMAASFSVLAMLLSKHMSRVEYEYLKAMVISNLLLIQVECRCLDCVGLFYVPAQDVHS